MRAISLRAVWYEHHVRPARRKERLMSVNCGTQQQQGQRQAQHVVKHPLIPTPEAAATPTCMSAAALAYAAAAQAVFMIWNSISRSWQPPQPATNCYSLPATSAARLSPQQMLLAAGSHLSPHQLPPAGAGKITSSYKTHP
jgi:hypothetical protein